MTHHYENAKIFCNPNKLNKEEREKIRQAAIRYDMIRSHLFTVCTGMKNFKGLLYHSKNDVETVYVVIAGNSSVDDFIDGMLPGARSEAEEKGIYIRGHWVEVLFGNEHGLWKEKLLP